MNLFCLQMYIAKVCMCAFVEGPIQGHSIHIYYYIFWIISDQLIMFSCIISSVAVCGFARCPDWLCDVKSALIIMVVILFEYYSSPNGYLKITDCVLLSWSLLIKSKTGLKTINFQSLMWNEFKRIKQMKWNNRLYNLSYIMWGTTM